LDGDHEGWEPVTRRRTRDGRHPYESTTEETHDWLPDLNMIELNVGWALTKREGESVNLAARQLKSRVAGSSEGTGRDERKGASAARKKEWDNKGRENGQTALERRKGGI